MLTEDNREQKRIPIQARVTIQSDNHSGDGLLMDFSSQGIGMLLHHNKFIDIGEKLHVNLETAPRPTTAKGIIKWARKLKESKLYNYAVGLELIEIDADVPLNLFSYAQSGSF